MTKEGTINMTARLQPRELEKLRKALRLTREQLADEADVSLTTIERVERKIDHQPKMVTYEAILNALKSRCEALSLSEEVDDWVLSALKGKPASLKKRSLDHLPGIYATYHLSTGDPTSTIIQSRLEINRDTNALRATLASVGFDYEGEIELDATSVTISLGGSPHDEIVMIKFAYPLSHRGHCMVAVYSALSQGSSIPVCGLMTAHKTEEDFECLPLTIEECHADVKSVLACKPESSILFTPSLKPNWLEGVDVVIRR